MNLGDEVERGEQAAEAEDRGCFLCLAECDLRCEGCGVPYCGEECLRSHKSKTREGYCLPFRIRHRAEVSSGQRFIKSSFTFFLTC